MIKAIVFDLDGVIVDAVEWHYLALNRALSVFGYEITPEEHASVYNGLPTRIKLDILTQRRRLSRELHPVISQLKQKYTKQILSSNCTANIKLSGLLRNLRAEGIKLAVASNSVRSTVELVLEKMTIRPYFDVVLSNEDVSRSKPNPEIFQKAFAQLGVAPEEAMVIEDSVPGIQVAQQATDNVVIVAGTNEVTMDLVNENLNHFNARNATPDPKRPTKANHEIEIVIPMAGLGQRFSAVGYKRPKPLIDVLGSPMIEWVVRNVRPNVPHHFTFICNQTHLREYDLNSYLQKLSPGCSVVPVPGVTEGAACTVLLAKEHINNQRPLILANSDQWVDMDIDAFLRQARQEECDGSIMTFQATENKWSYARLDSNQRVVQVAEKNPISTNATVGIYYFREGRLFVEAAQEMVMKDIRTNGEFYVCPVYNELIAKRHDIRTFEISRSSMHGLGTPEDLKRFLAFRANRGITETSRPSRTVTT